MPLRLYVDQDALDFMKKFFSFKDPLCEASPEGAQDEEIFFRESRTGAVVAVYR